MKIKAISIANVQALEAHEFANLFSMLNDADLDHLAADIKAHGQKETIKIYGGKVLDGRNRLKACDIAGVDALFEECIGTRQEALSYVLSLNIHRRQLKESQRAFAAARLLSQICELTIEEVAKIFCVSERSVSSAVKVLASKNATLIKKVENREIPVSLAETIASKDAEQQERLLAMNKKQLRFHLKKEKSDQNTAKISEGTTQGKTFSISFSDVDMEMIELLMEMACEEDHETFIHDLVFSSCRKKMFKEKRRIDREAKNQSRNETMDYWLQAMASDGQH